MAILDLKLIFITRIKFKFFEILEKILWIKFCIVYHQIAKVLELPSSY